MPSIEDPHFLRKVILSLNTRFFKDEWSAEDDLYELRIIDSYAIVQLIIVLEEALQIVFDYEDLHYDHLKTVTALADLLRSKYNCRLCKQT